MEKSLSREEYNEQRKQDFEDKKLEIIDAAQRMFFEQGLGIVTMSQIMTETNTSRATMYRYFPSIHPIVFEVQYRMMHEIFDDLKGFDLKGTPSENVYKCVNIMVENFHKHIEAYNFNAMFIHFYGDSYPDEQLSNDYQYFLAQLFFGELPKEEQMEKYRALLTSADVIFTYLQKLAYRERNRTEKANYAFDLDVVRQLIGKMFKD